MNILHITSDYMPNPLWGMGHSIYNIFKSFEKKYTRDRIYILTGSKASGFHKNIITTSKETDLKLLSDKDYEIIGDYENFLLWNHELFKVADKYIRKNNINFDIIHCHNWMSWKTATELKKKYNIKIVTSLHFLQKQYEEMEENPIKDRDKDILNIEFEMLEKSDAIICLNKSQINFLKDKYHFISKKVFLLPHFIEEKFIKKIKPNKNNILFIGRIEKDKGVKLLICVFNKLHEKYKSLKLYVVGDGPLLKTLKSNRFPNIIYTGYLKKDKLLKFYKESSIFCLPSKSESFGMAVTEAMSQGLCPIFPKGKYYPKLFKNRKSGITVNIQNNSAEINLYREIDALLANEEELIKLREGALEYAVKNFSQSVIISKLKTIYEKVSENQLALKNLCKYSVPIPDVTVSSFLSEDIFATQSTLPPSEI